MTWLEILNKFFLQIFFIRLARCEDRLITDIELTDVSILAGGNMGIGGRTRRSTKRTWYSIMFWVVPFTGWNSNYKFLGKQQTYRITKIKSQDHEIH